MRYMCQAMVALFNFLVCCSFMHAARSWPGVDLTFGFNEVPLNSSNLVIQKPYDLPESARYSFVYGVHKLWVYSTDKPHSVTSKTNPRTEIRITGYDYSSGVWQFEGHFFVPDCTSGVCIMQVFGAAPPHATTLMLRTYNGSLSYYRTPVLVPNIWGKWIKLNVIHDIDASNVKIYIDGVFVHEAMGRSGVSHYFKCGVYAQDDASYRMESRWKGIRVLKKCL
ncbi:citrate-binding protein-like [Lotus japonicus]|uniref:citrate-binding protein-like n=1 Tax=Lotus japonicus TaxID=34305 RepID=UPI0025880D63|nr:citrate-binding protein-like [Lotus japonicus]